MKVRILVALFCMMNFIVSFAQSSNKTSTSNKAPKYIMHIVKASETLGKIAKKYDVTVASILNINPSLVEDKLMPEQVIRIPNTSGKLPAVALKNENTSLKEKNNSSSNLPLKGVKYHTVEKGQTMYAIAKMYHVKVEDIQKWNQLSDNNLKLGQQIAVTNPAFKPNKNDYQSTPTVDERDEKIVKNKIQDKEALLMKSDSLLQNKPQKNSSKTSINKYHIVEKGQSLYAISKLHNVSVDDLKKWNKLSDNNIQLGQQILLSDPSLNSKSIEQKNTTTVEKSVKVDAITIPTTPKETPKNTSKEEPIIKTETSPMVDTIEKEEEVQAIENETQSELIKLFKTQTQNKKISTVRGTGAPMTTTLGVMESVYFAMHKTLPIGTVVKVKNPVNNKIVYAKIIGKLPDIDENQHVIIRYSLGVKKVLKLQNGKCYLQIEYPQ